MIKGLINNLIGNAGNILDEIITTKEEKLEAKKQIKQMRLYEFKSIKASTR